MDTFNLTQGLFAARHGLRFAGLVIMSVVQKQCGRGHRNYLAAGVSKMSFFRVVLTTIAVVMGVTTVNAQTLKPKHASHVQLREGKSVKPVKRSAARAKDQAYCLGQVMANEGNPNRAGWVSTAYTVLVRGQSGHYGKVGDYCAAAHASGQYTAFKKAPTAEMLALARHMLSDVALGKPTIEVALQEQLNGAEYFHNAQVKNTVGKRWKKKYRLMAYVEGHWMYRNKGQSPYRSIRGESPATVVASN